MLCQVTTTISHFNIKEFQHEKEKSEGKKLNKQLVSVNQNTINSLKSLLRR